MAREDRFQVGDQLVALPRKTAVGDPQGTQAGSQYTAVARSVAFVLLPVSVIAAAVQLNDQAESGPIAVDGLARHENLGQRSREPLLGEEPPEFRRDALAGAVDRQVIPEQAAQGLQTTTTRIAPHTCTQGVDVEKLAAIGFLEDRPESAERKRLRQVEQSSVKGRDRQAVLRPGEVAGVEAPGAVDGHSA